MYNISLNQFVINVLLICVEISENNFQYSIKTFLNRPGNTEKTGISMANELIIFAGVFVMVDVFTVGLVIIPCSQNILHGHIFLEANCFMFFFVSRMVNGNCWRIELLHFELTDE